MTAPADMPKKRRPGKLMRAFRKATLGLLLTATLGYGVLLGSYKDRGDTLTRGEIEMVENIFGDEVNTSKVRKHFKDKGHITHLLPGKVGTVLPPQSHIDFFGKDVHSADYSTEGPRRAALFIHEATHVWQNQNRNWRIDLLHKCRVYSYELKPNATFRDFGIEQQAEIIEDYYKTFLHKDGRGRKGEVLNANDSLLLKVVETRFPRARQTRLSLAPTHTAPSPKAPS